MDDNDKLIMAAVGLLVLSFGIAASQPYFEVRAFNKFTTGPKATYWDAAWCELRVQAENGR